MTIGIVEPVGGHGGMDYYDYGLSLGLGENDMQVRLYTSDETEVRLYKNVVTIKAFRKLWSGNKLMKVVRYVAGHFKSFFDLKQNQGEILHLHFFVIRSIDLLVLIMAKCFRFKVVVTIHDVEGFDHKASHVLEALTFKLMDKIIVHNNTCYNELALKYKKVQKISIIPHGNYLPFIQPAETSHQRQFTMLFFGQIKDVKGLDVLLQSLKLLKDDDISCKLIIAGKPWKSDLDYFTGLIDKLLIREYVETTFKYIPDSEVHSFYSKADLVVLPYKQIYQSGVLLLTMSYGKPVLCSDLPAFKEIIKHDYNGFIFEKNNPGDLKDKVVYIMNNKSKVDEVVKTTNKIIKNEFNWIAIAAKVKVLYKSL